MACQSDWKVGIASLSLSHLGGKTREILGSWHAKRRCPILLPTASACPRHVYLAAKSSSPGRRAGGGRGRRTPQIRGSAPSSWSTPTPTRIEAETYNQNADGTFTGYGSWTDAGQAYAYTYYGAETIVQDCNKNTDGASTVDALWWVFLEMVIPTPGHDTDVVHLHNLERLRRISYEHGRFLSAEVPIDTPWGSVPDRPRSRFFVTVPPTSPLWRCTAR